jgi:hypothetical protein
MNTIKSLTMLVALLLVALWETAHDGKTAEEQEGELS